MYANLFFHKREYMIAVLLFSPSIKYMHGGMAFLFVLLFALLINGKNNTVFVCDKPTN
jgi:hypothetical protein